MALAGWSAWHWVLQLRHGAIGARLADSHEARDPFARLDWVDWVSTDPSLIRIGGNCNGVISLGKKVPFSRGETQIQL